MICSSQKGWSVSNYILTHLQICSVFIRGRFPNSKLKSQEIEMKQWVHRQRTFVTCLYLDGCWSVLDQKWFKIHRRVGLLKITRELPSGSFLTKFETQKLRKWKSIRGFTDNKLVVLACTYFTSFFMYRIFCSKATTNLLKQNLYLPHSSQTTKINYFLSLPLRLIVRDLVVELVNFLVVNLRLIMV